MFGSLLAATLAAAPAPAQSVVIRTVVASVDEPFARTMGWLKSDAAATFPGPWDGELPVTLRVAKAAEKLEVYSRPMLVILAGQEGFCQVGQQVAADPTAPAVDCGFTLRVTPAPSADGGSFQLTLDAEWVGAPVPVTGGVTVFDSTRLKAVVTVPRGKTVCLPVGKPTRTSTVRLLFLTADPVFHEPPAAVAAPVAAVVYADPVPPAAAPNPFIAKPVPVPALWNRPTPPKPPRLPPPTPEPTTLPELLTAYRAACDRQDGMAASRLAVKALALDPTCFK